MAIICEDVDTNLKLLNASVRPNWHNQKRDNKEPIDIAKAH